VLSLLNSYLVSKIETAKQLPIIGILVSIISAPFTILGQDYIALVIILALLFFSIIAFLIVRNFRLIELYSTIVNRIKEKRTKTVM